MAGAITAGLWLVNRQLGVLSAIAAVAMAAARVYVGAHYPQAGRTVDCRGVSDVKEPR
jgi:undecaprenyl-diphosphatase